MKNRTRIFLIVLIVILMAAVLAAFTYCTVSKYAHAEYKDLTSDTVIYFNQLVPNDKISLSNMYVGYATNICNVYNGHKYYINLVKGETFNIPLYNYVSTYDRLVHADNADYPFIYNCDRDAYLRIYNNNASSSFTNFNVIDLTQMFGSGNEPTLDKCKQIFTSPSYNYTSGTIMYFGVGEFSLLQQLKYKFNTGTIYGYPQNITNTQVSYNDTNNLILTATSSENYSGYYLINFKTIVPENSVIKLNFNSYTMQSGSFAGIYYIDDEGQYITQIPTSTAFNRPFNFEFVTDRELSGLYLICDYYTSGTVMTCDDVYIEVTLPTDYAIQFQAQYDLGFQQAQEYYTNGYGYTEIWTQGYNSGKAAGLIEANGSFTAMDYVKSAFVTLGDILNIEVFPNFTLGAFFLLPLITSAIFFIIKISKGG